MLKPLHDEVFRFIRRFILRNGHAPSETEIGSYFVPTLSRRKVRGILHALVDSSYLTYNSAKRRGVEIAISKLPNKELPIIGSIPAGGPVEALETDQVLNISELLLKPNRYVLKVVGNSMSGDNICHGDYILCEQRNNAKDGDIIVALIHGKETTLKRLQTNPDKTITLLSSNPEHSPLIYPATSVEIRGVYLGLIRLLNHI